MIDLSNKIENILEAKEINTNEILNNINHTEQKTLLNNIESVEQNSSPDNISNDTNFLGSSVEENNVQGHNENSGVTNCLDLTIKKDYSLSVVKNIAIKALKTTWKVAVSLFTLNFLKFFL